ncbi:MAG: cryptochrome/photolyase family protein [Pseudomonadota bacterium]
MTKRKPSARRVMPLLGNHLFVPSALPPVGSVLIFMAEDRHLCTYVRHHQQKIVLFLAAMRHHAQSLREAGYEVEYHALEEDGDTPFEDKLAACLKREGANELVHFEVEDKPFEKRLQHFAERHDLACEVLENPMFLCPRERFAQYLEGARRPFMAEFYKQERKRLGVLMEADGENPIGGQWSFDADNRRKLPASQDIPELPGRRLDEITQAVIELVTREFPDHPGDGNQFWFPVTRRQALAWLKRFIDERLELFGPYQDALTTRSPTVFHSVLTPMLNLGLITPRDVLYRVERAHRDHPELPLQSIEGFIRQIIGWREFIRGIYRHHGETQAERNHWQHTRELTDDWYEGTTGIPPLDDSIRDVQRLGWVHHIPRLMVFGNLMTLCEIHPHRVHDWFMEMFVDSSEWVMGPNVYGMGIFSDGGIFATKPYICGSNYLLKMSDYRKGEWCDVVDGLYWRFIARHREQFASNPRLSMMTRTLDKMKDTRRETIFSAAEAFLEAKTRAA